MKPVCLVCGSVLNVSFGEETICNDCMDKLLEVFGVDHVPVPLEEDCLREFVKYTKRGFPIHLAMCKALAHTFAPKVPGVWRAVLSTLHEQRELRIKILDSVHYRRIKDALAELLACTRKIYCEIPDIWVVEEGGIRIAYEGVEEEGRKVRCFYTVETDDFKERVEVGLGEIRAVFSDVTFSSNPHKPAEFAYVGIITCEGAYILEVRLSERGKEALDEFKCALRKKGWIIEPKEVAL